MNALKNKINNKFKHLEGLIININTSKDYISIVIEYKGFRNKLRFLKSIIQNNKLGEVFDVYIINQIDELIYISNSLK